MLRTQITIFVNLRCHRAASIPFTWEFTHFMIPIRSEQAVSLAYFVTSIGLRW